MQRRTEMVEMLVVFTVLEQVKNRRIDDVARQDIRRNAGTA
jgi:hypothetical protein